MGIFCWWLGDWWFVAWLVGWLVRLKLGGWLGRDVES